MLLRRIIISVSLSCKILRPSCVQRHCHSGIIKPKRNITLPNVSVWKYVTEDFTLHGERTALECSVTGHKLSYNELKQKCEILAAVLHKRGVNKNDNVVMFMRNSVDAAVILLALTRNGPVVSPANPAFTSGELRRHIEMVESKIVFTEAALLPVVHEAVQGLSFIEEIVLSDKRESDCSYLQQLLSENVGELPDEDINPMEDAVILPFSSGTTGLPKGVMLTHHNVTSNLLQTMSAEEYYVRENTGDFQSTVLGLLPFYHIYGIVVVLLMNLKVGSRIITTPMFKPQSFIQLVHKYNFTILHLVPPLVQFLISTPQITKQHLTELYNITCGAAPLGKTLAEMVKKKVDSNMILIEGYGLTETSGVTHLGATKVGSIGALLPNTEAKVVDLESGETLGKGEEGELCIRGPQVMKGYYNDPEATAHCIKDDGWFHTGDVTYYDDDKTFYITGRCKELIKVKGSQVSPPELENLLRKHPGVADTCIIGIPDERAGELPRAYVVKKDQNLTETDVTDFLHPQLAAHKHLLGGVEFIDAIPKTPTGKILRRILQEKYKKDFA